MSAVFKVSHLLVCDDIRYEIGGKLTLVGTYGPTINVVQIPTHLRLAFRIEVSVTQLGKTDIEVSVRSPSNKILGTIRLVGEIEQPTHREVLPLMPIAFEAPEAGEYSIYLTVFGVKKRAGSFKLALVESITMGPLVLRATPEAAAL